MPKFSVFTTAYRNFSLSNLTIGVRCYQDPFQASGIARVELSLVKIYFKREGKLPDLRL